MASSFRRTEDQAEWNLDAWCAARKPQSKVAAKRIARKRKLAKALREIKGERRA
jgi:hypothetical protein